MSTPALEQDALASLEERILRAVELVTSLKAERDAALVERDEIAAERDAARNAAGSALAETQKLRDELESLRGERKNVRTRIAKLLGQMDLISSSQHGQRIG